MPSRSEELVITPGLLRGWPLPDPRGDKEIDLVDGTEGPPAG